MSIETAWLEATEPTTGQDQLAIRTTAVRMYSHLVPGITNVTDRARYYSLHSYLVHYWASKRGTTDMDAFYRLVRRAECLVGLADKLFSRAGDSESYGVIGTRKIDGWINRQGDLKASQKVPVASLVDEYFGNAAGGFGQYYAGAEAELGLIGEEDDVVRLFAPRGTALAQAFEKSAASCRLDALLERDEVSIGELRGVGETLGFSRISGEERRQLQEIFLDQSGAAGESGARRRETILLLLSLTDVTDGGIGDPSWDVLEAALHRRTPKGKAFRPPKALGQHVELWRVYAMHEHLAFALESILSAAVEETGDMELGDDAGDIEDVAERLGNLLPRDFAGQKFEALVATAKKGVKSGATEDAEDGFCESTLRDAIESELWVNRGNALKLTMSLLARLAARVAGGGNPYVKFVEDGMFLERGRLSLLDLAATAETSMSLTCRDLLINLTRTVLNTHLKVACAKLVYNRIYTYKVAYQSGRLTKVAATWPAFSHPRLQQTSQMCSDIGLLKYADGVFTLTAEGRQVLQRHGCS